MQDYEEDFPAPPTAEEFGAPLPAPPPRDSSKEIMMEYSSVRGTSNANQRSKH
jgi:hypothetical protein